MPRKFVFSHHPCIDGVASAWALKEAFPQADIRYQGLNHNERENLVYTGASYLPNKARDIIADALRYEPSGQEVYFVDYVPNDAQIIEDLLSAGHKVTIYDHHHTALHNLSALSEKHEDNQNFSFVFDAQKSGATITWSALHPDESPPPLLKLIEKMDLLTFDSDKELLASCYIDGYLSSPDQEENINSFQGLLDEYQRDGVDGLALKGSAEYAGYLPWMEKTLASARRIQLAGHDVTVVDSGNIMDPPRGLVHAVINKLTQEGRPPVLLMINPMRDLVNASVRVRSDESAHTSGIIEDIKNLHPLISGGGRGTEGQIGQGVCRMPPTVASALGITAKKSLGHVAPVAGR